MRKFVLPAVLSILLVCVFDSVQGTGLAGAPFGADTNDEDVVRLSKTVLGHMNKLKGSDAVQTKLVEVVKAQKQVVAGLLVKMTLKVTEGDAEKFCYAEVYERAWENKVEVSKVACGETLEKLEEEKAKAKAQE